MLQEQALPGTTLKLLKKLAVLDFLKDFNLVGETALGLYWGHRVSVDIDLFTDKKPDLLFIEGKLNAIDGAEFLNRSPIAVFYLIDSIKCDFLVYPYPFEYPALIENSLQVAALDDIVTMKMGAITNRGAKKDFIDLFYVLQHYDMQKLCDLFTSKYKTKDLLALFKSLTYFTDAEQEAMPEVLTDKNLKWDTVKKEIGKKVKAFIG